MKMKPILLILITLMALATEGYSATLYVDANGAGSSCTSSSPCTLSYALQTKCVAGDKIILNSGTYPDKSINLANASKHQNLTITTTPEVISALEFTRGIPSGSDNRPYFSSVGVSINVTGVTISYLRLRNAPAPLDGAYNGIIGISATSTTIDHCELWNGNQGIQINVKKQVTISNNHIHTLGSMSSSEDTHGVSITGTSGTEATNWTEAIVIDQNSIHDCGGDAVKENTGCYGSGTFSYLIMSNNNFYDNQEQAFDAKGTRYVRMYGNDMYENGYGHISANYPRRLQFRGCNDQLGNIRK